MKRQCRYGNQPNIRLLLGLFVVAFFLLSGIDNDAKGEKVGLYALVVGIDSYRDKEMNLKLAAKDARDVSDFLKERQHLFSRADVKVLLNRDATRENISRAFKDQFRPARKEDVVIIYVAGHGTAHPPRSSNFYFLPHDLDRSRIPETSLLMNDRNLFQHTGSDRMLLVADACTSGGYLSGLARGIPPTADEYLPVFKNLFGRFGMSAAGPGEIAEESPKFGNGIFTFFFLRGLRGAADVDRDGVITVKELFEYVASETRKETKGRQNPQLYSVKGEADKTPVYMVPVFATGIKIDLKFFYEDDDGKVRLLGNESVLKSKQHVGIAFKSDADCYVHILWWDSSGQVGSLFPNPKLTEGSGLVKAGDVHWLPSRRGKHWYVLDDVPGYETVYFVASRERNPKLEALCAQIRASGKGAGRDSKADSPEQEIEREINLMSFAEHTEPESPETPYESKEKLFEEIENKIRVVGADAFFKLRFKHEPK